MTKAERMKKMYENLSENQKVRLARYIKLGKARKEDKNLFTLLGFLL